MQLTADAIRHGVTLGQISYAARSKVAWGIYHFLTQKPSSSDEIAAIPRPTWAVDSTEGNNLKDNSSS